MLETMIAELRQRITAHVEAYHAGVPDIGDAKFDSLCRMERWLTDLYVLFEIDRKRP